MEVVSGVKLWLPAINNSIQFYFLYLQVACHLFQAGCNMVKLGIMKTENIAGDIGSLGIF